jgi:hypothetical protein
MTRVECRRSRDGNSEVEAHVVTLVLTVNGYESIWMLADRRLSSKARVVKEDARKMMILETTDGTAILGYAGLGATAHGTEPSDRMSSVLRGRNFSLEQSLGVLAEAMKKQFPRHMLRLPGGGGPAHNIIATAFLGNEARLYTIDLAFTPDRKSHSFRYTRHWIDNQKSAGARPPALAVGGTGALYLLRDKKWMRSLLRLVRACDRCRVSPYAVADHLANLNNEVHSGVKDKSVGPRCIVAWRHRKGGGGHRSYTGTTRDANLPPLPTIATGMDINDLVRVTMPHVAKQFEAWRAGEREKDLDRDELNAELARLPNKPDENLH